jgi:hypothetical protein
MSLIVARKNAVVFHLVSDTKLTFPEELFPNRALASPDDGVLKITILNPHLCIAFAGDVDPADEAIKVCRRYGHMINEIKMHLLSVNKSTIGKTEFILCVGFPEYTLYEIKNEEINEVSFAWIGSKSAFSIFQENALNEKNISKNLGSVLDDSIEYVIQSGRSPEVNGFRVSVSNEGNFFHFENYMTTSMPSRTYTFKENQHHIIEVYGTAQEGGYSVSFCENGGRHDIVGIHIRQGEFGVLYEIKNEGLLWPKVISNVDEHEFNEILYSRFGIKANVLFSSLQKSYLNRGNRSFANNDLVNAVFFYDKGLSENEDFLRPVLFYNKGLALLKMDRFNEACGEFSKASKLEQKFEELIRNVLFNR